VGLSDQRVKLGKELDELLVLLLGALELAGGLRQAEPDVQLFWLNIRILGA
jgi:hypothetical protein